MDREGAESAVRSLLVAIGENPEREGLRDTPRRVASMYAELARGLHSPPPKLTAFASEGQYDQIILVRELQYWSLCEHHLAPFFGTISIGYLPRDRWLGLSKFPRVVDYFAARPQVQERLTAQIADFFYAHDEFHPEGVIVVCRGQHLCMSMRGVKKHGSDTITTAIRGNIDKGEVYRMLALRQRD